MAKKLRIEERSGHNKSLERTDMIVGFVVEFGKVIGDRTLLV